MKRNTTISYYLPWIILGAAILLLCSCADNPIIVPTEVKVPVEVTCKPPVITEPTWNMNGLHSPSGINIGLKSCLADQEIHFGYESMLRAAITKCAGN